MSSPTMEEARALDVLLEEMRSRTAQEFVDLLIEVDPACPEKASREGDRRIYANLTKSKHKAVERLRSAILAHWPRWKEVSCEKNITQSQARATDDGMRASGVSTTSTAALASLAQPSTTLPNVGPHPATPPFQMGDMVRDVSDKSPAQGQVGIITEIGRQLTVQLLDGNRGGPRMSKKYTCSELEPAAVPPEDSRADAKLYDHEWRMHVILYQKESLAQLLDQLGHEADEAWQGVRDFIENVSQRTFRKLAMFIGKNGEGKTGAINNQEQPKSDGTRVGGEDAEAVKPHLEALQSMGASVAEGSASATGVFICGYLSEDEARRGQRSGGLLRAGSRAGGTGTNYAAITVMPAHAFNHIAVRLASEEEIQQECQDQIALLRNAPADDPDIDDNIDDTERVQAAEDFLCAATGQTIDDIRSKLEEWDSDTVQAAGSEIKVPVKLERVHAELAQQLATEVLNVVDGLAEELRAGKVRRLVLAGPVEYLRNSLQGILQCNHKNKGLALSKDTDAVTVYSVGWRHEFVSWVDTPGCDDGDTVNEDVTVKVIEDVDCVVMLTSRDLQGCKSLQRHYLLKENDGKGILKRLLRAEVERLQDDAQPFHFMYVINAEKDLAGKEGSADPEGRFQILQDPEVSRDFAEAKARTQKELFRLLVYENRKEGMNLPEEKLQEIADRIPVIVIYGDTHRSLMELKRWVSHRDLALTGMPALRDAIEQTVYPAFLAAEKTLRKSLRAARKPRAGNNPEGPPASVAFGSTLSRLAKCDPAELKAEIDTMMKHTRGGRDDIMSKVEEGNNRASNDWLQNSLRPWINKCVQKESSHASLQGVYYAENEHSFSTKLQTAEAVQKNHRLTQGIISKRPWTGGTVIKGRQERGGKKKITKRKLHDFVFPEHELVPGGARIKFTEMPPSEETAAFKASLESNLLTDFVQPMERLVQEFRDHLCEGRDPGSSNIPHWESYFDGKRRKSIESELKQMVASFLSVQPAKQTFGTVFRKFLHQAMWESIDEHICEPALHPPQCPESDAAHLRYMKGCIKDGLQPAAEGAMEKAEEALRTFCRERRRMLDLAMEAMLYKAVNGFITFVRHARKGKGKMGGR
ncbi:hypothetical protein CYMTET_39387 [Cymbomonas tetramitiformis]|uniref:Uncharacterized protein n=1 Tax=Cymbomonas tetramitiformis TaxID=36881 RepID=A0AAE0CBH7_9CHLO|nr:hypothetical protein CYMTET_39387 [Cymbomonas tetramitiformis]